MPEPLFAPIPLPGPDVEGVVAGITPPLDACGYPLDLAAPEDHLGPLQTVFGASGWPVYWIRQIHGSEVVEVSDAHPSGPIATADALMTDRPGILLLTRHADCPPVLVYDPVHRVLGLAHSGRKGTLSNIAGALVRAMSNAYGSIPADMVASIGPGIRSCCYQVGEEVLEEAESGTDGRWFVRRRGDLFMDLQGMIASRLWEGGLHQVHGEHEAECTCCGPSRLHSYRHDGTKLRFAAVAGMLP